MESIFRNQTQAPGRASVPTNLEVRAGRMQMEGKVVKPNPAKGKIGIGKEADGMVHFKWTNLQTSQSEIDMMVIPEDARFMKVVQSSGRVYVLEVSGRREFFWLQEPEKDKDIELIKKINVAMGTTGFSGLPSVPGASVPRPVPEETKASGPSQEITREQLQNMLLALSHRYEPGPGLDDVLSPEVLDRLSQDPAIVQRIKEHLPSGQDSPEDARINLLSPQLRQALQILTSALQSENAVNVLYSLGLGHFMDPQAQGDIVEELIKAIERRARSKDPSP